jgi:hypothetical protein
MRRGWPDRGSSRRAGALDQDSQRRHRNYQLVVPTTWNGSPRDAKQQRSSFEAGADRHAGGQPRQPVEICAPSIPLTRAWPAPCICTIRRDGTFTRFPSSEGYEYSMALAQGMRFGEWRAPVEYRRVYVWELPVRVYHWINAVALVLLCVTGYLIGAPIRAFYAAEAYQQYWFGWVRFIHFLAAFVYVFNFLARSTGASSATSTPVGAPSSRSRSRNGRRSSTSSKPTCLKPRCTGPSPPGTTRWPA